jgi:hypothetical protein
MDRVSILNVLISLFALNNVVYNDAVVQSKKPLHINMRSFLMSI